MSGPRWLSALVVALVLGIGSHADAQVFKPRGKTSAKASKKAATPANNQARTTGTPTPRRIVTKPAMKKAPVAERAAAARKPAKSKKIANDEDVVIDDDDDEVTITDD